MAGAFALEGVMGWMAAVAAPARAEIVGEFKALAVFFAHFFLTLSRAALQLRVRLGRE